MPLTSMTLRVAQTGALSVQLQSETIVKVTILEKLKLKLRKMKFPQVQSNSSQEYGLSSTEGNARDGDVVEVHSRQTRNCLITSRGRVAKISTTHMNRLRTYSCPKNFVEFCGLFRVQTVLCSQIFLFYQQTQYRSLCDFGGFFGRSFLNFQFSVHLKAKLFSLEH